MDFNFFKLAFNRCKEHYLKMFTLGLGVILLACIAFLIIFINPALELVAYFIILFGVLPLLLSYQLVCSRLFTNHEVNYNEIYKNYKAYFSPIFRGIFSVLLTILFIFIVNIILMETFFTIQIFLNYDFSSLYEPITDYNEYLQQAIAMGEEMSAMLEEIMYTESYNYYLLFCIGIFGLIAIYRTFSRMVIPYFNFFLGIPTAATKKVLRQIKTSRDSKYKKQLRTILFPLLLIFIIAYFSTSNILYLLLKDANLSMVLGFTAALILGSFYLPIYVSGCFELFNTYRNGSLSTIKIMLEQDITRVLNDPRIDDELKDKIKNGLDSYKQKLDDVSKEDSHQNEQ